MNARGLAHQLLMQCRPFHFFAQKLLDDGFHRHPLNSADRRLTTQLVYGVLRRRATLDALLRPWVHRRREQVEPWLWEILRLGTYQLAFLSHIPVHASLFETVELASQGPRRKAKGFLNGVLRRVVELLTDEKAPGPAANSLPWEDGTFRQLSQPVFPDPITSPDRYLATAFSWPVWLGKRWLSRWGWEECVRLGFWFAGHARSWLRVNPLKTNREGLLTAIQDSGVLASAGDHPQAIRLIDSANMRDLPGYSEGKFVVQDQSAMQAATLLNPQPGWRVLDLCAGPGGKTTHLAELMDNRGAIVACDVSADRLFPLRETCHRLGLTTIETLALNGKDPPAGPFDAVLVDVPCSNTGVLGKRPEVRWRLQETNLDQMTHLQSQLLIRACQRVRPGGIVVYSTCSIEPEENCGVVDSVLQAYSGMMLETDLTHTAGQPADGGYVARLVRKHTWSV